jgi:hypothetical protein
MLLRNKAVIYRIYYVFWRWRLASGGGSVVNYVNCLLVRLPLLCKAYTSRDQGSASPSDMQATGDTRCAHCGPETMKTGGQGQESKNSHINLLNWYLNASEHRLMGTVDNMTNSRNVV